jgi:hypothetical protein
MQPLVGFPARTVRVCWIKLVLLERTYTGLLGPAQKEPNLLEVQLVVAGQGRKRTSN